MSKRIILYTLIIIISFIILPINVYGNNGNVIFPPGCDNDFEKLKAVYSILEDMRLECNRIGSLAKGNWNKYKDNWYEYKYIYKSKRLPLLREMSNLKNSIRDSVYDMEEWLSLSEYEKDLAYTEMYGDKSILRELETEATSDLFEQLKRVNFEVLNGEYVDPYVDYTDFTEVDDSGNWYVYTDNITYVSSDSSDRSYVYYDCGVGGIGDLYNTFHKYTCSWSVSSGYIAHWAVTNGAMTIQEMMDDNDGISIHERESNNRIYLCDRFDEDYDLELSCSGHRYIEIEIDGVDVTCDLWVDEEMTVLDDTLYIEATDIDYQYLFALMSREIGGDIMNYGYTDMLDVGDLISSELSISNLSVIQYDLDKIYITWDSENDVMIRINTWDYPNYGENYLVYDGIDNSCNVTGLNLSINEYFISAYAYDGEDVTGILNTNIGGEDVLSLGLMYAPIIIGMALVFINFFLKSPIICLAIIPCMVGVLVEPAFQDAWIQAGCVLVMIWSVLNFYKLILERTGG